MTRVLLIYNPAAGSWRRTTQQIDRIARRFRAAGLTPEVQPTQAAGHATSLAREAHDEGFDAVYAYGGDGTLRECAAGLLGSDTPLGFLPAGTANVMARVLRLPLNPVRAAERLISGRRVSLDVGMCGDTPFLMQASVGLDAEVLVRLDATRKRWLGKAEVAVQFFPAWWSFRYPRFTVRWEGERRSVSFAAVCNIPFYGGPWKLAPAAQPDDRQLDLVLFSGHGRRATLALAGALLFSRHARRNDLEIAVGREIEIADANDLNLQLDGDHVTGALPARIRLAAHQVVFLTPRRREDRTTTPEALRNGPK